MGDVKVKQISFFIDKKSYYKFSFYSIPYLFILYLKEIKKALLTNELKKLIMFSQ